MKIADLRPNLLVQTKANQVLRVATIHNDNQVSAQVVYPPLPRTTATFYTGADVAEWRTPSAVMIRKYEQTWGFPAKLPPTWHRVVAAPKPTPVRDMTREPATEARPKKGACRP